MCQQHSFHPRSTIIKEEILDMNWFQLSNEHIICGHASAISLSKFFISLIVDRNLSTQNSVAIDPSTFREIANFHLLPKHLHHLYQTKYLLSDGGKPQDKKKLREIERLVREKRG